MWRQATAGVTGTRQVTDPRRRQLLAALSATVVAPGCASTRFFDRRSTTPDSYRPPLYRINAPADAPGAGWLLGTVHAPRPDLLPLPAAVSERLAAADVLAVELDVARRAADLHAAFTRRAVLPGEQTLEQWLSPAAIRALRQRFSLTDTRWRALRRLQPWALTRALHGTDRRQRPAGSISLERHLLKVARQQNKPVLELEQPAAQVDALAGGSIQWQAELLEMRATDKRFWNNNLDRLVSAWRRGDTRDLLAIKDNAFGSDALREPLRARMFTERDTKMARRIQDLLGQPATFFAAVGAFHLIGQQSLPNRLWRRGVRVERIHYH